MEDVKKVLDESFYLNENILAQKEKLQNLHDMSDLLQGISYENPITKTSNISNKVCDIVVKMVTLEEKITKEISEYVDKQIHIYNLIENIGDVIIKLIFTKRYLNCKEWKDIAKELKMSERHLYRLYREGLNKIGQ